MQRGSVLRQDDSKSPFHLLSDAERISALRKGLHEGVAKTVNSDAGWAVGGGVLRDPFRPIHVLVSEKWRINDSLRKWQYEELMQRCTTKKMTNDDDALNAFSAVLMHLGYLVERRVVPWTVL